MSLLNQDPLTLALLLGALALLPVAITMTTSYLKISVVLMLARNAIGVQQAPPAMALNGIALAITLFVMTPTFNACVTAYHNNASNDQPLQIQSLTRALDPLREFMIQNGRADQRRVLLQTTQQTWSGGSAATVTERDWAIVVPSFVMSELQSAFEIGFLIYIPFIVIDLLVSNILLALGMQMVSPIMLSLPLKILLFVATNGWTQLLQGLMLSYRA